MDTRIFIIGSTARRRNVAFLDACEYLSTANSDHHIAAGYGKLGHLFQHLLHLRNNELPEQNGLEETDGASYIAQATVNPGRIWQSSGQHLSGYLQQAEGRGLARLVVDVFLSISQQHLQLCL